MTTFTGNVYTDDVAEYTFAPVADGPCVLLIGEDIEASDIQVAPLGPGWSTFLLIQQGGDDGDVAVTFDNVTWFGGTPTVNTGTLAQTTIMLFSPDGVQVYGFGVSAAGALTVPQTAPSEPTQSATAAPAGGTGTAAGGWDTAVHRDAAIATINATVTDVAALITWADALQAKLVAAGIL